MEGGVREAGPDAHPSFLLLGWWQEGLLEERRLGGAGSDEGHLPRPVQHGEGEGDALRGGLGRVRKGRDLLVVLSKQRVAREQGRRVAVWPHTQEDEIEFYYTLWGG